MTTTATMTNIRWTINSDTRLSMSTFAAPAGQTTTAVALLRWNGHRWAVDHTTAVEFTGKDAEDMSYRGTFYASQLVKQELGECPLRFFRDNAL